MDGPMAPPTHQPRLAAAANHDPLPQGELLAPWWLAMGQVSHLRDGPWCSLRAPAGTRLSSQAVAPVWAPWRLQPDGGVAQEGRLRWPQWEASTGGAERVLAFACAEALEAASWAVGRLYNGSVLGP
jgi:hypothetical protein